MNINFDLIAEPQCGIAIDSSKTEYDAYGIFQHDNTAVINIIKKENSPLDFKSVSDNSLIECKFVEHPDETEVTHHKFLYGDGIYTIYHFVIPYINNYSEELDYPSLWYDEGHIIYNNEELTPAQLTTLFDQDNFSNYGVKTQTLCTCGLHDCYYHWSMEVFNKRNVCDKSSFRDIIYKRDMAWMAINVIDYLVDQGNVSEAAEILEKMEACGAVCANKNTHSPFNNCGCSG